MAKLLKPTNDPSLVTKAYTGRSTTIIEKLRKMFEPTDFVRCINPDTEAYVWQWLPPQKEDVTFTDGTVPMKITHRGDPEIWKLDAGESGTLVGSNAYVMMDGLIKRMMARKVIARDPNVKPGQARNFNFSDDQAQQEWIEVIYLGLDNPFETNEFKVSAAPTSTIEDQINEDLGLNATRKVQENKPGDVPRPGDRASEAIEAALG